VKRKALSLILSRIDNQSFRLSFTFGKVLIALG